MKTPCFGAELLWSSSKKHYRSPSYKNTCVCLRSSMEKGEGKWFQMSAQEQNPSLEAVTCSSCCCSCCNSPGLSGSPGRWRRRRRSVCQHPPTPGDREQGELQNPARRNHPPAKYWLQICKGGSAPYEGLAKLLQFITFKNMC